VKKVHTIVVVFAITALSSAGTTLVVPNNLATSAGNSSEFQVPATPVSIEFQELLGSGQFHSSPITITGISFRAAPGTGPVTESIGSLTVTLSNSPNFPNSNGTVPLMSSTFANNVGANKTMVFSGSNLSLKSDGCAANNGAPCAFDLNIVFQTPFVYSYSSGPLLIDLVETNISGSGTLDAASFNPPGGGVATVAGASGSATGSFSYAGPIVQVTYTTTAPDITGVVNVSSNIPPGMPNYGIAQGSLFAVYGNGGMGPATLSVASLPLQNTQAGTSVSVNVNGTTVNAPIFFTRGDIVVAVMPSSTPVGNGSVTLNYNNQTGQWPVSVVQSGFGISNNQIEFANNGIGVLNTASVTFENYQPVTGTNTAKPGDTLTIWGTGLGATPNGDDTGSPPSGNIGPAPTVYVGGVPSQSLSYWGRSPGTFPGLDQINFVVPPNAPLGCNVSVVVQTANGATVIESNGPVIALSATDGGTCSDPTTVVSSSDLNLSSAKVFYVQTEQNTSVNLSANGNATTSTDDSAQVIFLQGTQAQIANIAAQNNVEPSFGSCYVGINANPQANGPLDFTLLNAGPTITLTPPSGPPYNLGVQQGAAPGIYGGGLGTAALPGGTWMFSNGSGGPDVGPLSFNFPVPQPVTWSNQSTIQGSQIARSSPLTLTWTGGDSNGYVDITVFAQTVGASGPYYVGFQCAAPVLAGKFTIPISILLAMPPTFSIISLSTVSLPNILGNIAGFDAAVANSLFHINVPVMFK